MEIIEDLDNIPPQYQNAVLVIGNFDSVHTGHQYIINKAKQLSDKNKTSLVVLTFAPHPMMALKPSPQNINLFSKESKIEMLDSLGIDAIIIQHFDKKFSELSPEYFIEEYLIKKLKINSLVVGEDFKFGKTRSGSTGLLKKYSDNSFFDFHPISLLSNKNEDHTSSKIRHLLLDGQISQASKILGYDYYITNTVIKGSQKGRLLGFPTANLKIDNILVPKKGVYSALTEIDGSNKTYKSVANLGLRPTIDQQELLEVHLFDFDKDIYGKKIKIYIKKYIRPQIKFNNIEELKKQIACDAKKSKTLLEN